MEPEIVGAEAEELLVKPEDSLIEEVIDESVDNEVVAEEEVA